MWSILKRTFKNKLPKSIIKLYEKYQIERELKRTFKYDYNRYRKHSASLGFTNKIKLEGILIRGYHVIEKGLTMPDTRLGFGKSKIINLCNYCEEYIKKYNYQNSQQLKHALGVLKEYQNFHKLHDFELSSLINSKIDNLLHLTNDNYIEPQVQTKITKKEYFKHTNDPFPIFSNSRKSVRNYSNEEISEELMKNAISLALNAPSACNRQASHVYIYKNQKNINDILQLQGGANGFGHLTNKLIVITAELGVSNSPRERNQAFIDGGIFSMNMLYSLHTYNIAGCILNCNLVPQNDEKMHRLCNIPESEVFIAMISCGIPPDEFYLASSLRYNFDERCKFI